MEWMIFYPASGPSLDDSYWFNRHLFSPPGGLSGLGEALAAVSEGSVPGSSIWARLASLSAPKRWQRNTSTCFWGHFKQLNHSWGQQILHSWFFSTCLLSSREAPVASRKTAAAEGSCLSCLTSDPNKESLFRLLKFPVIMKETWMSMKHKSKTFFYQRRAPSSCCPLPTSSACCAFLSFPVLILLIVLFMLFKHPRSSRPNPTSAAGLLRNIILTTQLLLLFFGPAPLTHVRAVCLDLLFHPWSCLVFVFYFFCWFPTFHHIRASFQPGGLEWKWGTQLSMLLIFIS